MGRFNAMLEVVWGPWSCAWWRFIILVARNFLIVRARQTITYWRQSRANAGQFRGGIEGAL